MRKRPLIAYAILILGAFASFVCYTRLSVMLRVPDADAGTITALRGMMAVFALAAMILPFVVLGTAKRK